MREILDHLDVWFSPEFDSWGVTRFTADGDSESESDWFHFKSEAVRHATALRDNVEENLAFVDIYSKDWFLLRRIAS